MITRAMAAHGLRKSLSEEPSRRLWTICIALERAGKLDALLAA